MKLNRILAAVLFLALALTVVGCSKSGGSIANPPSSGTTTSESATAVTIVEKGTAFSPATIDVKVGETVTFKNDDSMPHNVNIDAKSLGNQEPGASVSWTAEKAGSFAYSCTIHPSMTGVIVVK